MTLDDFDLNADSKYDIRYDCIDKEGEHYYGAASKNSAKCYVHDRLCTILFARITTQVINQIRHEWINPPWEW